MRCIVFLCLILTGCTTGSVKEQAPSPAEIPPTPRATEPPSVTANVEQQPPFTLVEQALFNGTDLTGWRETPDYNDSGIPNVSVADGCIVLDHGAPQTGITWNGAFPRSGYEVTLEAKRVGGSDFFCGMTFPVGDEYCTLIVGGWGGMVVGLSNVDDLSAVENETTLGMRFEENRWYRIRLAVARDAIRAWIDGEMLIDLPRAGHRFGVWEEQEPARPFGINTWYTAASLRNLRLSPID